MSFRQKRPVAKPPTCRRSLRVSFRPQPKPTPCLAYHPRYALDRPHEAGAISGHPAVARHPLLPENSLMILDRLRDRLLTRGDGSRDFGMGPDV